MSEPLHPRDVYALHGMEEPVAAFLEALDRGRLHHAWLLAGPEGVGKATFAYAVARRLLGARPDPALGALGSDPQDAVSRQVAARAHPDLLVLERETYDGKTRRNIPVDEARKLPEFFSRSPASAPYRVAIIDAADDMNVNAANAVLKTLEEPPPKGVVLLVAHAPGRLLGTIRSRCCKLAFKAWDLDRAAGFVADQAGVGADDARRLAEMAQGAPGRAIQLAAQGALDADRAAEMLLSSLPKADEAMLQAMADTFRGAEGQQRFELLFERLADRVRRMAERTAGEGAERSPDRWADAWETLVRLPVEAEAVNLDRQDAFWTAVGRLREAARA